MSMKHDGGDLVRLTMYHMEANAGRNGILQDIDDLIKLAEGFYSVFKNTNWEESDTDWESALAIYYNGNKPHNWNKIEVV